MNFNELIANRANQLLGGEAGRYDRIHPNDHINRSQSTNDVYPAAMKIAVHALLAPLAAELAELAAAFEGKSLEFENLLHLGRTCMQDAQPMTLGQVFSGYAALTRRLSGELRRCARSCWRCRWAAPRSVPGSVRPKATGRWCFAISPA